MTDQAFSDWPLVSRDVGLIIREALGHGARKPVHVDVYQFGEEVAIRLVEFRDERGWVVIDYGSDEAIGEDVLYEGGDLFDAAFTAVVGRPPRPDQRATPLRIFDAMTVRRLA